MRREAQHGHALGQLARTVLVLVVCAAALAALAASRTTPPLPTSSVGAPGSSRLEADPLVIPTRSVANAACPMNVSMTADGTAVAFLGTTNDCAQTDAESGEPADHRLIIFDVTVRAAVESIALDPIVLASGLSPSAAASVQAIHYVGLGWSPDGKTYAIAYIAFDAPSSFSLLDTLGSGLLLINRYGKPTRVIRGDAGFFAAATSTYAGLPVWNTAKGAVTAPIATPASLSYAWKSGTMPSALAPLGTQSLTSLPADAGARYPVGDPSHDATFTVWQPGVVLGPLAAPAGAARNPRDGAFVTNFTTWSPDGTYVTMMVAGVALSWPSDADAGSRQHGAPPSIHAPATLTETPARDAALQAVEHEAGADGWALVAWNPDGSLLASIQCHQAEAPTLELRATSSGAVVGRAPLSLGQADPGCGAMSYGEALGAYANPNLRLTWSPDGSRVLLSDQAASSVTEWNVSNG